MLIGYYDQEIKLYDIVRESNGYGGYDNNFVLNMTTFARVEQLKQSKSLLEVQQSLPTAYRVGIHFDAFTPTLDNVIGWNGDIYTIITTPTRVDKTRNTKEWVFDIAKR